VLPEVLEDATENRETKSGGSLIYRVLRIRFNFIAEDGSSAACTVIGEGMDTGDKASNKAMAVALKYALTQMLLLPYDEVDPDATTPEPSKPKAKRESPHTEDGAELSGSYDKSQDTRTINEKQGKLIYARCKSKKMPEADMRELVRTVAGVESSKEILRCDMDAILEAIDNWEPETAQKEAFDEDGAPLF
jgi:hypothetical protein